MSGELTPLHRLLRRVARYRRRIRRWIAFLGTGVILCAAILGLFCFDWLLQPTREIRLVGLLIAMAAAVLAFIRYVLPWLRYQESELDIALLVEKHHGIDSDLVAALQFERPEAARWGSVELERHVIRRVAELAQRLPLIRETPRTPLRRRVVAAVCGVALLGLLWMLFPDHLRTFTRRLLLEETPYPTATRLVAVYINGQAVPFTGSEPMIRCAAGQPVTIAVVASGYLPAAGKLILSSPTSDRRTVEQTLPRAAPKETTGGRDDHAVSPAGEVYRAELPALQESVRLRILLGDAATNWLTLVCLNPPAVVLMGYVEDPRNEGVPTVMQGVTQITVTEGSRVTLGVASDRPLRNVVARMDRLQRPLEKRWPASVPQPTDNSAQLLTSTAGTGTSGKSAELWWLDPEGLPLSELATPQHILFEITDENNLTVDPPLEATLLVRPDYPPQVTARALTKFVLPTAKPTLVCQVRDDLGIEKVTVQAQVIHPDGNSEPPVVWTVWEKSADRVKVLDEKWKIDLSRLSCRKGDRVELVISATDIRRPCREGAVSSSEPIALEVTDLAGILAIMSEIDRQSAEELREMIDKQLDVGGGP